MLRKTRTHLTYHFLPRPYPLLPLPSTLHCWTHFSNNPIFPSSVFKYSTSKSPKVTECVRQRSKVKTLLLKRFALGKFHVIDDQNTREDMTSDRRSEPAWSQISFEGCNSFLTKLPTSEHRCMRNSNLQFRIAGSSCLPANRAEATSTQNQIASYRHEKLSGTIWMAAQVEVVGREG